MIDQTLQPIDLRIELYLGCRAQSHSFVKTRGSKMSKEKFAFGY